MLERRLALAAGRCGMGSNPNADNFASELWQFRFPALPVSFGGNSKSRRSLLSGVYARGSKRSHQSALECVGPNCRGLHHAPTLNSLPPECDYAAEKNAALHLYRKKKNPAAATSLRTFGNSVYPALPVSFGGHNKAVCPFYLVSMPGEV